MAVIRVAFAAFLSSIYLYFIHTFISLLSVNKEEEKRKKEM